MLTHGVSFEIEGIGGGIGGQDDVYNFELMMGIQGSFLFPVKIEDGVAYYADTDGNWSKDECFPREAYNKWVSEKLEEELGL